MIHSFSKSLHYDSAIISNLFKSKYYSKVMDNRLLIKILDTLEETCPETYHIGKLAKKLNTSIDGEFYKIIKYLKESKKVKITYVKDPSDPRERLQQNDWVLITNEGIDFLTDKKLLESNEKRNNIIKWATIIIAISALINLIVGILNYYLYFY